MTISIRSSLPVNLNDLHDVSIFNPQTAQYLRYNASVERWQNAYLNTDIFNFLNTAIISDPYEITLEKLSGPQTIRIGLPTINPTVGTYGAVDSIPIITVDETGRITSVSTAPANLISGETTPEDTSYGNMALDPTNPLYTGEWNTAVGVSALAATTSGDANTALGTNALKSNTAGSYNTALGYNTLQANTTGNSNVALGNEALFDNTTGSNNIAIGNLALHENTTENYNIAIGTSALYSNTTGDSNIAIGTSAMSTSTGDKNIAIGNNALANTTTAYSVAIGENSLAVSNTGAGNTALGYSTLSSSINGSNNTALGYNTLSASVSGSNNTAVGYDSLKSITSGSMNTGLGYNSGSAITSGNNNVVIGGNTGSTIATSDNNIIISDGSGNIRLQVDSSGLVSIPGSLTVTGPITGNASSATKLATPRSISTTGDATWTVTFDGTADVTNTITLATVNNDPQIDTFRRISVNGKGLVVATSAVLFSDITASLGYRPVNDAGDTVNGTLTFTAGTVTGIAAPVQGTDAATKNYVDSLVTGLHWKQSVRLSTTAANGNIVLSTGGLLTIDGVATAAGDRVLVKNQTNQAENGIYIAGTGAWVRADDSSTASEINGTAVFVSQGATLADTGWTETATVTNLGTDPVVYAQFAGAGTYIAGTGLALNGNTFSNTGVLSVTAGTGITVSPPAGTGNITIGTASIPNGSLTNSSLTIGSTTISLGGTSTTLAGLTSVTSTGFTGALSGNASTATTLETSRTISLSGDVSGSVSFNGSSNVDIISTVADNSHNHTSANISDATSANTANMIVKRDASGNFSAGTITASTFSGNLTGNVTGNVTGNLTGNVTGNVTGNLTGDVTGNVTGNLTGNVTGSISGNAATASKWLTARTVSFATGDVTGSFGIDGSGDVSNVVLTIAANSVALGTDTTGSYVATAGVSGNGLSGTATGEGSTFTVSSNATSANTASTIVFRDSSGNFSAGTITAALSGNATTASTLQTARTINSVSFNGSANISFYDSFANGQNSPAPTDFPPNSIRGFDAYSSLDFPSNYFTGITMAGPGGARSGQLALNWNSEELAPTGIYFRVNDDTGTIGAWSAWRRILVEGEIGDGVLTMSTSGNGISGTATFTANQSSPSTFTVSSNATSANTPNTIVYRDASGNFSAGTITATSFSGPISGTVTGNATTASSLQTARTIELTGDVTGSVSFDGSTNVSMTTTIAANSVALGTDTTGSYVATAGVSGNGLSGTATGEGSTFTVSSNATSANTPNTIVFRDAAGNFSAGTITATTFSGSLSGSISGNAGTASALQTARTISLSGDVTGSVSFDGSTNVSMTTTIAANSVALGTDTTGDYVATAGVSGNGLSGTATGEGSIFTVTSNATSANTPSTIVFRDASGNFSANIMTGTATAARYADLAERYEADAEYPAGTVVVFGGDKEITVSTTQMDRRIAGVISTNPAYMMNCDAGNNTTHPYVALTGRVPCKVVGTIRKGDMLVSGIFPGVAVASADPSLGSVIGKALADYNSSDIGVIEIVVGRI